MGDRRLEQVKGFRVPARYRVVALTIWPGLAPIWSGQAALGLLWGGGHGGAGPRVLRRAGPTFFWYWPFCGGSPAWFTRSGGSDYAILTGTVRRSTGFIGKRTRLTYKEGGEIRNVDSSRSWRETRLMPTLSCNW